MKKTFYSNGKLLITAEYLVLDGARALALPTKFGQNLTVENGKEHQIVWKSFDSDGTIWFETTILFSEIINNSNQENASERTTLIKILHEAYKKNSNFIKFSEGYIVETRLTFPKIWGLGTSSTLISNIAQWLQIDAFELLNNSFGGSGYDIACAQNNTAILYHLENHKPIVKPIVFKPKCAENLYFVYLNQKQNSKSAIAAYYKKNKNLTHEIEIINQITADIIENNDIEFFTKLLQLHEKTMSTVLKMPTVKSNLFSDFEGEIKSLGAWGGDFVMVVSKGNPTNYFKEKGFFVVVPYSEMIIS